MVIIVVTVVTILIPSKNSDARANLYGTGDSFLFVYKTVKKLATVFLI